MSSLKEPASFSPRRALHLHWPEYLIEAWALAMFMLAASVATTLIGDPPSLERLVVLGLGMGATSVGLIYSPWGRRSGTHMNPAVTLAFASIGRISPINALGYIAAQFLGGWLGVAAAWGLLGDKFARPPVNFIATVPGAEGALVAALAESVIAFALMFVILNVSNSARWSRYTGIVAGAMIAAFVAFESPLSGFSMNPARTVASALPSGIWRDWWIYFAAPISGMVVAAQLFRRLTPRVEHRHHTAKIVPTHE